MQPESEHPGLFAGTSGAGIQRQAFFLIRSLYDLGFCGVGPRRGADEVVSEHAVRPSPPRRIAMSDDVPFLPPCCPHGGSSDCQSSWAGSTGVVFRQCGAVRHTTGLITRVPRRLKSRGLCTFSTPRRTLAHETNPVPVLLVYISGTPRAISAPKTTRSSWANGAVGDAYARSIRTHQLSSMTKERA